MPQVAALTRRACHVAVSRVFPSEADATVIGASDVRVIDRSVGGNDPGRMYMELGVWSAVSVAPAMHIEPDIRRPQPAWPCQRSDA